MADKRLCPSSQKSRWEYFRISGECIVQRRKHTAKMRRFFSGCNSRRPGKRGSTVGFFVLHLQRFSISIFVVLKRGNVRIESRVGSDTSDLPLLAYILWLPPPSSIKTFPLRFHRL